MTATPQAADEVTRPRPAIHFTADDGWVNDPYGIAWVDGRYHMYYQAVPGQVVWGPNCHWGHAVSEDLVHWVEQPLALVPQPFEVGCWSGSVVHTADPPLMFYTRVGGADLELGQAAIATYSADGYWHTSPEDVVVPGPPPDLAVRCFRDPNVIAVDDGWRMLMATALEGGVAAVLQYRSEDLRTWEYDGVLCSRSTEDTADMWTGSLWECPQLFQVDQTWVLLVSVWDEMTLHYVAAAVGDYDGHTFTPRSWQRLTYGNSAYAMAAFTDREGRPCVMSWLREEPQNNPDLTQRAGAQSVAQLITLDRNGTLVLQPHPNLRRLAQAPLPQQPGRDGQAVSVGAQPVMLTTVATAGATVTIDEPGRPGQARGTIEFADRALSLTRPGLPDQSQPIKPGETVTILLDADITEVFTPTSYAAYRIAPATTPARTRLLLTGHPDARTQPLGLDLGQPTMTSLPDDNS